MKKLTILLAAMGLTYGAGAQCPKFVLMEQFTQASCGPCAAQNPGYKNTILTPNPIKVHHIGFHTSWPGVDPMYNFNTGGSQQRVTFYNVTGVPFVAMLGNQKQGSPSSFIQKDVDNAWAAGSPMKIQVTEVDNGNNRDVSVSIKSIGVPPSGSYTLYVAVVERNVNYTSPPGNNGETYFPNVFRVMATGGTTPNNANGVAVTLPSQGNAITMGPYNYLESVAIFNATELGTVAWIQNNTTKEVIQCAASWDPPVNAVMTSATNDVFNLAANAPHTFNFTSGNSGNASETFTYTLSNNAPGNWSSGFTVNSTPYTTTGTVTVPANTVYPTTITVTPGATPGVARYTLTMQSTTNPSAPPMITYVYVISGVTDLIVNNTSGFGDPSITGDPSNFQAQYTAGLTFANCTTYGITDVNVLQKAVTQGQMGIVKNLYMNMAWSFPSLTDGLVASLSSFLNVSGHCMFICGQDIAWETMDPASTYDTPQTQAFFTNYMNAAYVADGPTAPVPMTANVSDAIFGTQGSNALTSATYGSSFFFPDYINAAGLGQVIYYYNGNTSNKAGVRSTNGTYKVVYLAPGIEQMSTVSSKNTILKLSYDWFNGLTSTEQFDQAMLDLSMGQNYPNPSTVMTTIPVLNLEKDVTLQVVDLAGRMVYQQFVPKGTENISVNTSTLEAGMYMYRLVDGQSATSGKPMQVVH